ncbi:hypothetical protein GCM10009584_16790 [Ornithinimicrobium humiphilum]|uniref:Uncharacterized protein n=1 Tax=Ornithinimicrobium humiphilum TaxID=125288 RepID=A0A543KL12_9MICO|nr:hypothetical protein FB476_0622 [Ornithinimicrobium humiphilum]
MGTPTAPGVASAAPGAAPSARYAVRRWQRVVAGLMVPFWSVLPGMGLIDLQVMFVPDSYYADSVALMVSWGAFLTFLVALPFGWFAVRPQEALPVAVVLAVGAATLLVGAVLGGQWPPAVVALLVVVSALPVLPAALHQARAEGLVLRVRPALLLLPLAAAPTAWRYAADAFSTAQTDPSREAWQTNGVDHWPVQGSLAIAVVALLVVLAHWPRAVPVVRAAVAITLGTMALCWAAFPDTVGSVDSVPVAAGTLALALLVALTGKPATARSSVRRPTT